MSSQNSLKKDKKSIGNLTLIIFAFATAFFPRVLTYFGAPSPVNFIHFLAVPAAFGIIAFTTKINDRKQIKIFHELSFACLLFLTCVLVSSIINQAGFANILLQYLLLIEPFIMLLAIVAIPIVRERLVYFKKYLFGFLSVNLVLALIQSVLLPIGIYPRRGGTIQDNTAGVFAGSSGSAGNYVSCTVSVYFALYLLNFSKSTPLWLRITTLILALYQTYVSDSKQVFLAFILGVVLLILSKLENPVKILAYVIPLLLVLAVFLWAVQSTDVEFLSPYRNWIKRSYIYAPGGDAFVAKTAALEIIPSHFETPLNWFFGLGPGHTVTRLGGWMIRKYASLLAPLGVTLHPASGEVFQVMLDSWIIQESSIFAPLFTWVGIWGDFGVIGLIAYLYICFVVWKHFCLDDTCRFLLLSTAALGFMLTQMEEPGQMLTIACFLGLRWHERQAHSKGIG
ncbi:MAG: hypothetical protein F6K11_29650 [Leptolyngbya sp. SIO3F4]|nr:hypothetical protein [Leptolyngbya sp. SIO3F4]